MCGKNTDLMCVIIFLFLIRPLVTPGIDTINEGVQKVFGTLDLFVSLLETEIKYPILQGGILPFWTPSFDGKRLVYKVFRQALTLSSIRFSTWVESAFTNFWPVMCSYNSM